MRLVAVATFLGLTDGAYAHGIAGNRLFPGTLTFDDPAVADELILPAWSSIRRTVDGANMVDQSASWSFMRLLTPTVGIGVDSGFIRRDWNGARTSGPERTSITLKSEVYRNDPHEALVAACAALPGGRQLVLGSLAVVAIRPLAENSSYSRAIDAVADIKKFNRGLLVVSLAAGGPAEQAGVFRDDVLIELDGEPCSDMHDMPPITASH